MTQNQTPAKKFTVALPQTHFPMKGDLPKREPEILKLWESQEIMLRMMQKNAGKTTFVLPDGPPYANGSIHIGHALNKTLKDIIVKYKNLKGYQAIFRPGWDCHGLPIEQAVNKKLGDAAKTKTPSELRALCRAEATQWVGIQLEQFKRLGVFADWANPYRTMDPDYEAQEVREFAKAYKKGVIYRGVKPVYWNWSIQTALAEAEVEYHNLKSPSIYVKFPVTSDEHKKIWSLSTQDNLSYLIWTTTPWTLPANVAICLNEEFEYGLFKTATGDFIVAAKDLKEAIEKDTQTSLEFVRECKGKDLAGQSCQHAFYNRPSPLVFGEHVTKEAGTGCVHTAPGHGPDDYKVGLKYQLPVISPVGPDGTFTDEVPEYKGIHIYKANPLVIEHLQSLNLLYFVTQIEHSYPHCWRTKVPLMYRATPQWFIGLDLPESQIRQKSLRAMESIGFFPEWGRARFKAMIENRPDWCLSRQRIWGVPIPVLTCKKTGEPLADYEMMLKIADIIESGGGIDAFYQTDPKSLVGSINLKGDFGSEGFTHGQDILDVWFDSGICHAAVQSKTPGMSTPADIYLEGSDQHRGWFNTSMLTSMVTNGEPPFKNLITHGFIQQAKGVKMSKSSGKGVDPLEFSNTKGADILRLWCSHEDYGKDIVWGDDLVDRVTETYRRLRNTLRFLLGVQFDFDHKKHLLAVKDLMPYDQWALHRLNGLIEDVTKAYDEYAFYKVYHLINNYVTVDLSALYLDILKDRLYTFKIDGQERRSGQTVVFHVLKTLNGLIAPILSFLAEEVYQHRLDKSEESIFLTEFPKVMPEWQQPTLALEVETIFKVRDTAQKQLEDLRNQKIIGSSLEASVSIWAPKPMYEVLAKWEQLREILIVSEAQVFEGEYKVESKKAEGEKCPRCWVYSKTLDSKQGVCPKCLPALGDEV